jgi:hypothetical protein
MRRSRHPRRAQPGLRPHVRIADHDGRSLAPARDHQAPEPALLLRRADIHTERLIAPLQAAVERAFRDADAVVDLCARPNASGKARYSEQSRR